MKRWLERNLYDRIFETELGDKLKSLDKKVRYGIEFGLNLLTAFFEQKLSEDTALKKFVKEIGIDVAPEVSKRLINNAKEQLVSSAESSEDKELVNVLLELDDQTLIALLDWLYNVEQTERTEILKQLSQLSFDELVRLAQLTPENRKRLFDLFKPAPSEKFSDKVTKELKSFNERLEKWLEEKKKARKK
ncbi:MAG: hypothetical protein ABIM43_07305 [candidate division WOR-3 bacterium]